MPQNESIIGLPDLKLMQIEDYNEFIQMRGDYKGLLKCYYCSSLKLRMKDSFDRVINHSKIGAKVVRVKFKSKKYKCLDCHKYFNLKLRGLLPKKQSSENFRQEVFENHLAGHTQKHLSRSLQIGEATVERWTQGFLVQRVKEMKQRPCPKVLGIDEHFFTKKQGYATTFVDLKNHGVFDVVLGRSELSLEGYLRQLPGKEHVQVVVMDLSSTYRAIVKKHFPKAMIVADRFHVVRLVNHHFLKTWQQLEPEGRKNRGLLSLMRRHEWNLDENQRVNLRKYLKTIPALEILYEKKQELIKYLLIKTVNQKDIRKFAGPFMQMIHEFAECPFEGLKTLGKTLKDWLEPIVRMWRFRKTNSITEGFHNKMEMISRRAFGFRNFNNYRIRVLALCGWDGLLAIRSVQKQL